MNTLTGAGNTTTAAPVETSGEWAFDAYEKTRHRLPSTDFPKQYRNVANLAEIADAFDVFLLDAFGVLNVGESPIKGAPERILQLQAMGKRVMVVSNAAGYPKRALLNRYPALGFDFHADDVLTSREVVLHALNERPAVRYGVMAPAEFGDEEFEDLSVEFLQDEISSYDQAQAFVLLGSSEWNEDRQRMLETSLKAAPRPVLVGNPDIIAPRENGLSREPGYYAHHLVDALNLKPAFYGKPFGDIFRTALRRVKTAGPMDLDRVVMVGDTLQTDILGGRAAGLKTALITGFGALKGMDAQTAIARSGIVPDFVMERP